MPLDVSVAPLKMQILTIYGLECTLMSVPSFNCGFYVTSRSITSPYTLLRDVTEERKVQVMERKGWKVLQISKTFPCMGGLALPDASHSKVFMYFFYYYYSFVSYIFLAFHPFGLPSHHILRFSCFFLIIPSLFVILLTFHPFALPFHHILSSSCLLLFSLCSCLLLAFQPSIPYPTSSSTPSRRSVGNGREVGGGAGL